MYSDLSLAIVPHYLVSRDPPEVGASRDWVGKLLDFLKVVGHRHGLPDLLGGHDGAARDNFVSPNESDLIFRIKEILKLPMVTQTHKKISNILS